ncbi:STAS-like domain-containing protein [Arcobacteraceae bacterium]|nr:STAS-like domain-containing protein [Arcobacteraceae bacterium]
MKIIIFDITDNSIVMSSEDGKKLFDILYETLKNGKTVELSFKGIDIIISHVLNESIGKLYEKFENWEELDSAITYQDIEQDDYDLITTTVIPTAKNHFLDIERSERLELEVLRK